MKQITILLCSFFLLTSFVSPTVSLKGVWNTGDQNTKIKTYQKDGKWYGKIISSDNPKAKTISLSTAAGKTKPSL